jgi:hypothetical protein
VGGRRRILEAVPDCGDDDRPVSVCVAHRGRLERRKGVLVGIARIAEAADAEVDHAGAVLHRPADRAGLGLDVDEVVGVDNLGNEQLGGGRHAGDSGSVVEGGRDHTRDERAVPLLVDPGRTADEGLSLGDFVHELRVGGVDARVDHRDAHRSERGRRIPVVERAGHVEMPLALRKRVVGHVGKATAVVEPLDVGGARQTGQLRRRRAIDDECGQRSKTLRIWEDALQPCQVGLGADPDRVAGGVGGGREERGDDGGREREALHRSSIRAEKPSANPCTGATRAR